MENIHQHLGQPPGQLDDPPDRQSQPAYTSRSFTIYSPPSSLPPSLIAWTHRRPPVRYSPITTNSPSICHSPPVRPQPFRFRLALLHGLLSQLVTHHRPPSTIGFPPVHHSPITTNSPSIRHSPPVRRFCLALLL